MVGPPQAVVLMGWGPNTEGGRDHQITQVLVLALRTGALLDVDICETPADSPNRLLLDIGVWLNPILVVVVGSPSLRLIRLV